jgi:RNA polymerase sigma-70 factor (ECF subfamily)
MLGSTSVAADAVQEAWIRLSRSNAGEIDNLEAWPHPRCGHDPDADAAAQQEVVEAFLAAARDGDFDALVAVLDPDIVVREDTGSGTIIEVRGAENVARRAMAFSQLGLVARPARINGAAGWVSLLDGEVYAIGALTLQNGRITTMDILLDPARLARLDLKAFDSRP